MKKSIKLIAAMSIVFLLQVSTFAQTQEKFTHTVNVGFPFFLFDFPNKGIHLSYNPQYQLSNRFSLEGQLSYSGGTFKEDDDNFAHNGGHLQILNTLAGARFYLTKKEKKNQLSLNFLLGHALVNDKEISSDDIAEPFRERTNSELGYSIGLNFMTKKNINFGIALESYFTTTLKVGYTF